MTDLPRIANKLFEDKRIDVLLGWKSNKANTVTPYFFTSKDDIDELVFNDQCVDNLVTYIEETLVSYKNVGIVVKGCDGRSLVTLIAEKQLDRERVTIISPVCEGVQKANKEDERCADCATHVSPIADHILGKDIAPILPQFKQVQEIEKLNPKDRWAFFSRFFKQCDRCYACRQVCPLCYCETCIVDQQDPQWIDPSTKLSSNTVWHLIRAYHLAGRCADCGGCERVCPEHIPLRLLNISLEKTVMELFKTRPGTKPDEFPALATFNKTNDEGIMEGNS